MMKFTDNSRKCKEALNKALERSLKGCAEVITSQAKTICPVDTGRLRSSIHNRVDNSEMKAQIGTGVEYSAAVEFGTYKQREQPYLRPAFRTKKQDCEAIFKRNLSEIR